MNGKKTWLKPVDPYFTIEIDFSEDIEHIREQIEELKRQEKERVSPDKAADPNKEEAAPSEEANPAANE